MERDATTKKSGGDDALGQCDRHWNGEKKSTLYLFGPSRGNIFIKQGFDYVFRLVLVIVLHWAEEYFSGLGCQNLIN